MKEAQDTLKYKNLVANLESCPAYAKKAALIQALSLGKQWRIDAVMDAIDKNPMDWQHNATADVVVLASMFGRKDAIERIYKTMGWDKQGSEYASAPNAVDGFNTAVLHGHYELADYFHALGAKAGYMGKLARPAIYAAISEKNNKKINYLLDRGIDASYVLYHVIADGNPDRGLIRSLVEDRKATVNRAVEGFWSPFMAAVQYRHSDIAYYLLDHGAVPAEKPAQAREIVGSLIDQGDLNMLSTVLKHGLKAEPFDIENAVSKGKLPEASVLIREGHIDMAAHGHKALMLAALAPNPGEAFDFCVSHGARPQEALDRLKQDTDLFRYGPRDKMLGFLEVRVNPPVSSPTAAPRP